MPSFADGLRYATYAIVLLLIVSGIAFFTLGPGLSWFYLPPAPSPSPQASPSPSPVHEIPFPSPEATPTSTPADATNATNATNSTNETIASPSPSPSPVQVIEVTPVASSPLTQFGLAFSRSSFPVLRRSELPTALAVRFGDLDADGNLDVFFFQGALSVQAFLSGGQRVWSWDNPPFEYLAGVRQAPGAVWDFDRNGRPEVVFFKAEGNKTFLVVADAANGNEKSKAELNFSSPPTHLTVAAGDFSKSGWKSDLVVLGRNSGQQKLFFYDFSLNKLGEYNSTKPIGFAVEALDVNGDGREEAIVSGAAVQYNGSVLWSHGGAYASAEAEEISLVDLQGDGSKEIVFSYGKDGLLVTGKDGKEVWSSSLSRVVHASKTSSAAPSSTGIAAVLETREPSLEQGLVVFSSGGGQAWTLPRKPAAFAARPFDCKFAATPNLFFAGRFYDAGQGNSSFEEFGRGLGCADLSGDGREEMVSLREDAVAGAYLDVYTNPVSQQPAVARRNSELDYLLEKGTLGITRG